MLRQPPIITRTYPLLPYPTLFRSNMVGGVILEGDGICGSHDFPASSDDLFMASFRQHDRQLRVYLCPSVEQKARFAGPDGMSRFLREANRSEEHTSELQSLMRISYAVFCLKKKK